MRPIDAVVVGAGIAGLRAARGLGQRGLETVVLERSRGVGGRCATRRLDGQPVDHGVAFLHGSDPEFLRVAEGVSGATIREGWPTRIEGRGSPCQARAFDSRERRLAYAEGLSLFAKHLAADLRVERNAPVTALATEGSGFCVEVGTGASYRTPRVVLALPVEQTAAFLDRTTGLDDGADSARALLRMVASRPCLTCIAAYESASPEPGWDILFPESSPILNLVSHDSTKRHRPERRVLVVQARPAWSRAHLAVDSARWAAAMLRELGRILGAWASVPIRIDTQRWTWARLDRGDELVGPIVVRAPGGGEIGLAGEYFGPGGGVEGAWISGRRLAERLASEE